MDTVLNLNPSGAGSLSAVLGAAAAGDTIVFAPGLSGTITPSATLTLANSVTIQGPGAGVITVSGGGTQQVFHINAGVSATISGLTITGGLVSSSTASVQGGAIDNEGNLALLGDVISNSMASATGAGHNASGGGIFSNGSLSLVNCSVSGNTASVNGATTTAQGGGIDSEGPVLSVSGCTITGNTATAAAGSARGGGIQDASPTDAVVSTTFTTNTASVTSGGGHVDGGGYNNDANSITTFTNLTFSGNTASAISGTAEGGGFDYASELGEFTNVNVTGNTASSSSNVDGGGAFLDEPVNWTGGLVSGNTATSSTNTVQGGGIWINDRITLSGLTVTGNTASNTGGGNVEGGGIFTEDFTVVNTTTVSGNKATANSGTAQGGGIWNNDGLTITASTIANNSAISSTNATANAAQGGGIWNSGQLAVTNATLFANSVAAPAGTAEGGGLFNSATATLINDTLASNTATGSTAKGGGIFNSSTLKLANTIIFDPSGAATDPDVSGTITAAQNSLFGSNVAGQIAANANLGGNQFSTNPLLGPLQNNGGPTATMALLPGSPAIGAGVAVSLLGGIPSTDQRGLPRPGPAGIDIGAFQTQPPPPPPPPPQAPLATSVSLTQVLVTPSFFSDVVTLTAQVTSPGGTVAEGTVTFTVAGRTAVAGVSPNGLATAILTLPGLSTGTRLAIAVSYGDNGGAFASSASSATVRFIPVDTLLPSRTSLQAGGGETITDLLFGLFSLSRSYDAQGRLTEVDFNGIALETFGYNAQGQLVVIGVLGFQVPLPVGLPPQQADLLFEASFGLPLGV